MRKNGLGVLLLCAMLSSCVLKQGQDEHKIQIDVKEIKATYGDKLEISPLDESVNISKRQIVLSPVSEGVCYTISGYFNGQIVNTTKNTEIRLKNAFIENNSEKPAISSDVKFEVSAAKGTKNYIVSQGRGYSRTAALRSKRSLVIGGGGDLFVRGKICHGVEAEDMKLKGTGNFYFQGTRKGSAVKCDTLSVEEGKTFNAYFMNSKNGIKADRTVNIASGNFFLYNNSVGIKTDISSEGGAKSSKSSKPTKARAIILSGGTFHTEGLKRFYVTDDGAFQNNGATIIEEGEE